MTAIPNLACNLAHIGTHVLGWVTDEMLCTVASDGRGACGGDSGGPIVWQGTVVGVVSWGLRPCGQTPTVFIRVAYHIGWLQQTI